MNKKVYNKLVTPIGISQYCWLNTPDTKFDKENGGHFKTNLIVKGSEAQSIIKSIKDEMTFTARPNHLIFPIGSFDKELIENDRFLRAEISDNHRQAFFVGSNTLAVVDFFKTFSYKLYFRL